MHGAVDCSHGCSHHDSICSYLDATVCNVAFHISYATAKLVRMIVISAVRYELKWFILDIECLDGFVPVAPSFATAWGYVFEDSSHAGTILCLNCRTVLAP